MRNRSLKQSIINSALFMKPYFEALCLSFILHLFMQCDTLLILLYIHTRSHIRTYRRMPPTGCSHSLEDKCNSGSFLCEYLNCLGINESFLSTFYYLFFKLSHWGFFQHTDYLSMFMYSLGIIFSNFC